MSARTLRFSLKSAAIKPISGDMGRNESLMSIPVPAVGAQPSNKSRKTEARQTQMKIGRRLVPHRTQAEPDRIMKTQKSNQPAGRRLFSALLTLALAAVALTGAAPLSAQTAPKGPVAISLTAQKVSKDAKGKEQLKPADRALPGEVVQYDALYKNTSGAGVKDLQPTLPIPTGLEFLPESVSPMPAFASVDGRTFAPFPLVRKVTLADGTVEEQAVPASEYRALRWSVGALDAGKSVLVSARARLAVNNAK